MKERYKFIDQTARDTDVWTNPYICRYLLEICFGGQSDYVFWTFVVGDFRHELFSA
jgi:hypothetical protein